MHFIKATEKKGFAIKSLNESTLKQIVKVTEKSTDKLTHSIVKKQTHPYVCFFKDKVTTQVTNQTSNSLYLVYQKTTPVVAQVQKSLAFTEQLVHGRKVIQDL